MDLDQATTWLDGLPLRGEIVELAAGTGFWSPLLAQKGELSLYDALERPLERARDRLVAHGLRAHLHVRDAWTPPDRQVDAVFTGFWLSHVPRERLGSFLDICRAWLKPGGRFAFIDSRDDPQSGAVDRAPAPGPDLARRRLADGREFTIPKVFYEPGELMTALRDAGFVDARVTTTHRFFTLGEATT
jgi:demethylmenaquinone methyltransferase/2-methoxy-6-polyprenyl-1,4-benzoquinol methylase